MATPIPRNDASFTGWELAAATAGDLTRIPTSSCRVTGVVTDSRTVSPGNAFVAVRGRMLDGHAFLHEALAGGAAGVVVSRGCAVPPADIVVVEVEDTTQALGMLGRAHLQRWRRRTRGARVLALTGSAGKTTTKELVATLVGAVAKCHATSGNLNNRIGLPLVALGVADSRFAVFELGMNEPGEIGALTRIVEPDVGILLNVGIAHAEGFGGSRSAIAREKGRILEGLADGATAVVNADDDAACDQLLRTRAHAVRFGTSSDADVRVAGRETSPDGSFVTLERDGELIDVQVPLASEALALDLAAAVAGADALLGDRVPVDVIARALAAHDWPAGRLQRLSLLRGIVALDDTYNANPASMRAALGALAELRRAGYGRAIAVLGEMRELGPLSDGAHHDLGRALAEHQIDLAVGCGGAIDAALEHAGKLGVAVKRCASVEEAGAVAADLVRSGDAVLFKGSRGATVERALAVFLRSHPVDGTGHGVRR